MNDSKNLAMMFLLGAFVTGGALGFTADRYMNRDKVCMIRDTNAAYTTIIAERLHLSDEQRKTINAILDQRTQQWRVEMTPIRPRLDSIKMNAREQMRRLMTDEQKVEFEALLKELNDSTRKDNDD